MVFFVCSRMAVWVLFQRSRTFSDISVLLSSDLMIQCNLCYFHFYTTSTVNFVNLKTGRVIQNCVIKAFTEYTHHQKNRRSTWNTLRSLPVISRKKSDQHNSFANTVGINSFFTTTPATANSNWTNRTQFVDCKAYRFKTFVTTTAVPHGSILGPLFFNINLIDKWLSTV